MIRTLLFCTAFIFSPALVHGNELTKLDPDRLFSDLYLREGEKRVEAGELPQGRFFLKESTTKNPLNARAYNLAGIVEARAGRMEAAETYFLLATTADPECSECRQNLGNIFLARGKPDLALMAFYRVLLDESYHAPWLPLYGSGIAYLKKENYDRAVEMFERVLKYVPAGLDTEIRAKINRALYLKNRKEIIKR